MTDKVNTEEETRILGRQLARELTEDEIFSVSGGYSCPSNEDANGNPIDVHSGQVGDQPY